MTCIRRGFVVGCLGCGGGRVIAAVVVWHIWACGRPGGCMVALHSDIFGGGYAWCEHKGNCSTKKFM